MGKRKKYEIFLIYNSNNFMEHIDILIENPIDFKNAHKRRKVMKIDNTSLSLIDLDDLIKLKEFSAREL